MASRVRRSATRVSTSVPACEGSWAASVAAVAPISPSTTRSGECAASVAQDLKAQRPGGEETALRRNDQIVVGALRAVGAERSESPAARSAAGIEEVGAPPGIPERIGTAAREVGPYPADG